jgi:PadR family transcriptional regulator, regulatory protein AphA
VSLRHALLAMLAERPKSGYELTKEFDREMGNVWAARHSQIYPELAKLLAGGLIELDGEGPRGRKSYRITEPGRHEATAWLRDGADRTVRNEALLKMFFLDLLDAAEQRALIERELDHHRQRLSYYDALGDGSNRVKAQLGSRYNQAMIDWLEFALVELERA